MYSMIGAMLKKHIIVMQNNSMGNINVNRNMDWIRQHCLLIRH